MPVTDPIDFGFKRLTLANWLSVDPAWEGVVLSSSRPNPAEAWVHDLIQASLQSEVPTNIRRLFDVARGALIYSLMFYPLLTVGAEQLFRVSEASVSTKCKMMNAPNLNTFLNKVDWLAKNGVISAADLPRWNSVRQLRNAASHPADQAILPPGIVLGICDATAELINMLFMNNRTVGD